MKDPYRINIENGKISIALFNDGNPIPYTSYKGKVDCPKTERFIRDILNNIGDKKARDFLKFFVENSKYFKNKIEGDFEEISRNYKKR
jgi:hypothetical protein